VIIEYKRSINENVINQGLFYLDWLMDHKAEFKLLVIEKLGKDYTEKIEWSSPRLLCIANNFTKYDEHAVKQINRNIELIRYKKYDDDMLLFELVNSQTATEHIDISDSKKKTNSYKTFGEYLKQADSKLTDLYHSIQDFILNLGDDVQEKELKYYKAYKRIKNFICLEVKPQTKHVLLYLRLDPSKIDLKDGLIRDVSNVGHYGTGDLELKISTIEDFEQTKHLIMKSYEMG
jgi:predicted transport protein